MDKVYVNEMTFYGYHGVFEEENKLGQKFVVDVILEKDLSAAGMSDQLEDTINYADIYKITQEIVEGDPYDLIEAVAEAITGKILRTFISVQHCHVKVVKPNPPIPGNYDSVAVEITRSQSNDQ